MQINEALEAFGFLVTGGGVYELNIFGSGVRYMDIGEEVQIVFNPTTQFVFSVTYTCPDSDIVHVWVDSTYRDSYTFDDEEVKVDTFQDIQDLMLADLDLDLDSDPLLDPFNDSDTELMFEPANDIDPITLFRMHRGLKVS